MAFYSGKFVSTDMTHVSWWGGWEKEEEVTKKKIMERETYQHSRKRAFCFSMYLYGNYLNHFCSQTLCMCTKDVITSCHWHFKFQEITLYHGNGKWEKLIWHFFILSGSLLKWHDVWFDEEGWKK